MKGILEGLLFVVGDDGLTKEQIKSVLEIDDIDLNKIISDLTIDYETSERGIRLDILGDKIKLVTKKEYKDYIQKLVDIDDSSFLSDSALETLAIIAYNQPVTRIMVDEIRGIGSIHMIHKLLFKELIKEVGRSESAGRPILYGTTDLFLDYFGLKSLDELPILEKKEEEIEQIDLFKSKYNEENIEKI